MLIKLYTNQAGIELLKAGYSAYVFDEPLATSKIPFLIHNKDVEFTRAIYGDSLEPIHVYYASGKISVMGD